MFFEIGQRIKDSKKIGIFTHINPDGDALGSAYALKLALISTGKEAQVFLDSQVRSGEFSLICDEISDLKLDDCDLLVAVDCAERSRIGRFECLFQPSVSNTIAIDHHLTHEYFAALTLLNDASASTGELIYELLKHMDVQLNEKIANNLYVSVVSDTGGFKYASTTEKTFKMAADLVKFVDVAKINKVLFDTLSFEYIKLMKIAFDRVEFYCDGRLAVLQLDSSDLKDVGISESEVEPIINFIRSIVGVEIGVFIRQRELNYKVSMRSNFSGDLSKIALKFGGGGHARSSGFVSDKPANDIKDMLISEINIVLPSY